MLTLGGISGKVLGSAYMLRELLRAGIASTSCIASKWYRFPWNVSEHGVCLHQPHG